MMYFARSFSLLLGIYLLMTGAARAADEVTEYSLPEIVKEGDVSDVLMDDPILPAQKGKTRPIKGSGGVDHSISNDLAIPFNDSGAPGVLSQIRGLGKRTEETDVQAYGIPLNGAQGGGFDFSTFPQFLWDDYRYQIGPSLGAFDPTGVAGSLTLVPWTSVALTAGDDPYGVRATGFYGSNDLRQFSIAGRSKDNAAAVIGYSTGSLEGPSGSFSSQYKFGEHRVRFHFLGTDVYGLPRELKGGPLPFQKQDPKYTTRLIPVLQTDFQLAKDTVLKSTFFYDRNIIRSEATGGNYTRSLIQQEGIENALVTGDWKFGMSARHVSYDRVYMFPSFASAGEASNLQNIFNFQASRAFQFGRLLVEPTARATLITHYDALPEGSLGARYEFEGQRTALFSRISYTRKFPSLVTKYYSFPPGPGYNGFVGNAELAPERDLTFIVGEEAATNDKRLETTVQLMVQQRYDGEIQAPYDATNDWYVNADTGTITATLFTATFHATSWLDVRDGLTLTHSRIESTGTEFPVMPSSINVLSVVAHAPGDTPNWDAGFTFKAASDSYGPFSTQSDQRLPGYGYLDLNARYDIIRQGNRSISLSGGIENLFDREIEINPKVFTIGRIYTLGMSGQF